MSPNGYSLLADQIVSALATGLLQLDTQWPGSLHVEKRHYKENDLPNFPRYAIFVSPSANPWDEREIGVRTFQYIYRYDLYLLVKNFDDKISIFGTTAPDLGLFQLVNDVKEVARSSTFGGLITASIKEYKETAAPALFYSFTYGFDGNQHTFVHRAKLVFEAKVQPFCVQPVS